MKKFKKPELKKSEVKPEFKPTRPEVDIRESTDLNEVIELQKQGWIITDVKSAQIGVRPKIWVLRKELL